MPPPTTATAALTLTMTQALTLALAPVLTSASWLTASYDTKFTKTVQ